MQVAVGLEILDLEPIIGGCQVSVEGDLKD
jgi:hypothetical protein